MLSFKQSHAEIQNILDNAGSGGGGGGTSDYADLTNKPSINSVTLSGNKTSSDLGIKEVPTIGQGDTGKILTANFNSGNPISEWATPTAPDIAYDAGGTITLSNDGTAVNGSITIANDGFINISFDIDYDGVYPLVSDISADFSIDLTRNSSNYYILTSHVYFQGSAVSQTQTNNNYSVMVPVKAGDVIHIMLSSKQLDQGTCATIINNTIARYLVQKYV